MAYPNKRPKNRGHIYSHLDDIEITSDLPKPFDTAPVSRGEYDNFRQDFRDDLKELRSSLRRELILMLAAAGVLSGVVQSHLGTAGASALTGHVVTTIQSLF